MNVKSSLWEVLMRNIGPSDKMNTAKAPTFCRHHVKLAQILLALCIDELEGVHSVALLHADQ